MGQEGGPDRCWAGTRQGRPGGQREPPAGRVQQERLRPGGGRGGREAEQAGDVRDQAGGGAAQLRHQVKVYVSQVPAEVAFQIPRQNLLWWMQGNTHNMYNMWAHSNMIEPRPQIWT